jgi:hypothetical protein
MSETITLGGAVPASRMVTADQLKVGDVMVHDADLHNGRVVLRPIVQVGRMYDYVTLRTASGGQHTMVAGRFLLVVA